MDESRKNKIDEACSVVAGEIPEASINDQLDCVFGVLSQSWPVGSGLFMNDDEQEFARERLRQYA